MEHNITTSFLQVVAGDIEKLLLENQEQIAFAYLKIPDGIKLSMGISFDPSSQGIVVSYDLSFDLEAKPEPPEKHKVKFKHTIDELQSSMEFLNKEIREGRMSIQCGDTKIGNVEAR
jgi:hypothetical protein